MVGRPCCRDADEGFHPHYRAVASGVQAIYEPFREKREMVQSIFSVGKSIYIEGMRRNERALRGRPGQYDVTEGLCGHVVESSGRPHWAGLPGKWEKFLGRRVGLVGECGWRYTLGPRRGGLHPAASLRARKPGRLRDGPVVSTFGKRDGVRKRAPLMGEGCRNGARRGHRAVHQGQRRPPPGRREVRQTRTGTRLLGPHPKVASGRGLYCVGEGRPPG